MKSASITRTKNHLSEILDEVKSGQSVLILDRNIPVARLDPVVPEDMARPDWVAALVRQGLVSTPRKKLEVKKFIDRVKARPARGASALDALLADREEGR